MKVFLLIIMTILFTYGCSDDTDSIVNSDDQFTPGKYSYSAYDSAGYKVVFGWFQLSFKDSTSIYGEWHFYPIGNPRSIGPQIGEGEFVGGIEVERIWMELNPQFKDNNVFLSGSFYNGKYQGEWQWITIKGPTANGTFRATKM
jgi:hypothetical protein